MQRTIPQRSLLGTRRKQERASERPVKVLIQDGCSIPVLQTFEDFRLADTGVCVAMLRSGKVLAILMTKQVEDGSEEVGFEVKTAQGQSTVWKRYLVQLGTAPVMYKCSAARGGAVCGRLLQEALSSRRVDHSPDPTEVSNHTLRQEVRCGASGHVPTQMMRERACRSGGSRQTASRRCFAEVVSSVSSLAPSLSRTSPACPLRITNVYLKR